LAEAEGLSLVSDIQPEIRTPKIARGPTPKIAKGMTNQIHLIHLIHLARLCLQCLCLQRFRFSRVGLFA
jgi:hypothetical protein